MSKRAFINILFASALRLALLLSLSILIFLIGSIIWQGGKAISLDFLLSDARDFGASGGIRYQI